MQIGVGVVVPIFVGAIIGAMSSLAGVGVVLGALIGFVGYALMTHEHNNEE